MKYIKSILIIVMIFMGIISINTKEINIKKGVYYDNFNYTNNVTLKEVSGTTFDYSANLKNVGEYYEISFDIINDSNVDMIISDYTIPEEDKFIDYNISYTNGTKIKQGDIIKPGELKKVKYKVLYKNQIDEDHYQFDPSFEINYEQNI